MPATAADTITFSITGQGDYTGWMFTTFGSGSSFEGVTTLNNLSGPPFTPWVNPSNIKLYSRSTYHFDAHATDFPIKPNNPAHDPGPVCHLSFEPSTVMPAINPTTPATDQTFYFNPPGSGSIEGNGDLVTGGSYATVGLLRDGALALSYQSIAKNQTSNARPSVWPSLPAVRQVDHVGTDGNIPGSMLVTLGDGAEVYQPNPPPPFSYGIYHFFSNKSGDDAAYNSGGPPIDTNKYNGTYPPQSAV
jgi:hypothetical protein